MSLFEPFPKMPRLFREIVITEKLDGTNAQIYIDDAEKADGEEIVVIGDFAIWAGSRNRWLRSGGKDDNYGFGAWVEAGAPELIGLGKGRHFGEWWGRGIQRAYGMEERKFSLFNVARWGNPGARPACCDVVPVLYRGEFSMLTVEGVLSQLAKHGSVAAPGFTDPEGIITFHTALGRAFKTTVKDDGKPKGQG